MLASSLIVLLTTEAMSVGTELPQAATSVRYVVSARAQVTPRKPLPRPTSELRRSTEALRKTLARRHPGWSPEAEAQAASVQQLIDGLLDFEEIAKRTLPSRWEA